MEFCVLHESSQSASPIFIRSGVPGRRGGDGWNVPGRRRANLACGDCDVPSRRPVRRAALLLPRAALRTVGKVCRKLADLAGWALAKRARPVALGLYDLSVRQGFLPCSVRVFDSVAELVASAN